jgi:hypothetical protein
MQYWLSIGDGKSYGPYDLDQLQKMVAAGETGTQAQVCAVGGTDWAPLGTVVAMSAVAPPAAPAIPHSPSPVAFQGASPAQAWTPVSLVGPVLSTLCCCLPGGIASIVYASSANSKAAAGDYEGARRAAASSKTWMIVSIVVGVIVLLINIVLRSLAAANSNGY